MKLAAIVLALVSAVASAKDVTIIGTLKTQAGGLITFTSVKGSCPDNQLVAYIRSNGGKVAITGCFSLVDDQLFVLWSDGDLYTYPMDNIEWTPEFLEDKPTNRGGI